MATTDNAKYKELVRKLKEIFQIDKPELDFGIYRILHMRQKEIEDFLDEENGLLGKEVKKALAGNAAGEAAAIERELNEDIAEAKRLGYDPDASTKVRELKARLNTLVGSEQSEGEVYSYLLKFFRRYYEDGDFVSKRRYKGDDTYAIPYSGEEVKLHWANADQYYTKTGESFTNYEFTLENGAKVHFSLVTAETAKDNIKDNDYVRCFVLWNPENTPKDIEEKDADRYPQDFIEEKNGELFIYFQYLKFKKGTNQKGFRDEAMEKVRTRLQSFTKFSELDSPIPVDKGKGKDNQTTLLQKHLKRYTDKNTSDYFIHKDLGGFLRRELDFYIKNEIMELDDIENATAFHQIEAKLRIIQTVRVIARKLIDFMAQLENFQKKLWLKKKFVVQCDWCVTLSTLEEIADGFRKEAERLRATGKTSDMADADDCEKSAGKIKQLIDEAKKNPKQIAEWKRLGVEADPKADNLTATDARMIDTKFFGSNDEEYEAFKAKLLAAIPDLDARTDGVLVHSENFQALRLMHERYMGSLDAIHIDPPYNTNTSGFLYKKNYQHSSWASMMLDRLNLAYKLLNDKGFLQCHIDENEYEMLVFICNLLDRKDQGTIIWDKLNPMLGGSGVATQHEYILTRQNSDTVFAFQNENATIIQAHAKEAINMYGGINDNSRKAFAVSVNKDKRLTGGEKAYHLLSDDGQIYRLVAMGAPEKRTDPKYYEPLIHPITKKPCPVPSNGFSRKPETIAELIEQGLIVFGKDEAVQPQKKVFLSDSGTKQVTSVIQEGKSGKADLDKLGLSFPYAHPVELYDKLQRANNAHCFLDFFAGSGTTGHAVIDLNRQDGGDRKYILVEMGEHFDTVLKPRIEKVVYSPDWKDGKPQCTDKGISHCFKYLTLESYEDTLNNLELSDVGGQLEGLLKEDFLIKYMLDVQSRGSIIDTESFKHPFDYKLKVAVDSSGASEARRIDLVETFNWLIGIRVTETRRRIDKGYVIVTGMLPGEKKESLIIWRDVDKMDNTALMDRLKSLDYVSKKDGRPLKDWSTIYINGDHSIPNRKLGDEEDAPVLNIRQIENVFLEKMFEEV